MNIGRLWIKQVEKAAEAAAELISIFCSFVIPFKEDFVHEDFH